jgi:hypothetical protein
MGLGGSVDVNVGLAIAGLICVGLGFGHAFS